MRAGIVDGDDGSIDAEKRDALITDRTAIACPGGRSVSWATFTYAAMSQLLLALIHDDSVAAYVLALLASHGRNRPRKF